MSHLERHRVLREALRHYTEFRALVMNDERAGPSTWDIAHKGIRINFLDLQDCLRELSPRKKEAVFLNVIMDMKQKDVAERMGVTTGSVNQYVEQSMIQIAARLWPEEGEEG